MYTIKCIYGINTYNFVYQHFMVCIYSVVVFHCL